MQTQEGGVHGTAPVHPAAFTLQAMYTLANEIEREVARRLGLNLTDYRALSALAQSAPVTVGTLAAELGATAATTTAIISRLEAQGYAARNRGDGDRRQVHVSITPAATAQIADLTRPLMTATNSYLTALPPAHQAVVGDFLEAMLLQMQAHLHTLSQRDAR
ncbi:MAG: MarR family transcriptional regulator [Pseudarthrobacter sp.]|nr:MarR family transcriptional regulator [Pseudarthrobacter sp.]